MVSNIFTEVGGVDIFGKTFGKLSENFGLFG
jgi:predicted transcriptional regulator